MISVMIVEDDPMVAEFNKRYLEQIEGFEVAVICRSAEEAMKELENHRVELLLLDIFMAGQSGLDLLAYIRKSEKEIDVIVISAASDKERIQKAMRLGAVDYLIKPFEFERFSAALSSYREKSFFWKDQNTLSQEELDQLIHHQEDKPLPEELPKGLSLETLKVIWEVIEQLRSTPFSTDDIVSQTGISRVSVRKYLKFLSDIGVLEVNIHYGTVGRPVSQHSLKEDQTHRIQHYL
ncbi:response regulator [Fictibacillus enclensis]|uniref:response regulator n=1 Tax=Fictibacillus enclensis TaxID=1017270 RepID=UPI0025A166E0|nr:response regulator [Fictibacillus enclensis]MDM5337123.1 response regulator [Fictibacillus enclensis]